jgi:hypothetical protein
MEKDININYSITSDGKVYSKRSKKFLKPFFNTKRYLCVDIHIKSARIHRLVAEAFLPNPKNLSQINHIDGDKTNNNVNNLEWCDNRQNVIHYYSSKSPGVSITKYGNFHTKIYLNKKQVYLGTFKTLDEANLAYSNALAQHNASSLV